MSKLARWLTILAWTAMASAAAAPGEYKVYLTAAQNVDIPLPEPATTFTCSDRIFAVLEVSHDGNAADGQHHLQVSWRNPAGEDQEITRYPFQVIAGDARVWAWLKLSAGDGAAFVRFMNPSAGMGEFVGQWELLVEVDGERIARKPFEVIC